MCFIQTVSGLAVLALATVALPSALEAGSPLPGIEALQAEVDPARSDWESEAWQSRVGAQLARLAELMSLGAWKEEELTTVAVPEAKSTPLGPAGLERLALAGEIEILRLDDVDRELVEVPLADGLRELIHPYKNAREARYKFKIVGVTLDETERVSTVRFEAAARTGARVVQQTAYWRIEWSPAEPEREPRIAAVRLESFEEVSRPGFLFTEVTGSVLPAKADWAPLLRYGGDYWYGRLDLSGEPALLGHNGIAVGDFDGDGRDDLYVALGTGLPNKLLMRNEDGTVHDAAGEAGVDWLDDTKGVLFADMDNDGDQDLLMALGPTVVMCKNGGSGKCERFLSMRAPTPAAVYSLSVADYDLDGDLDIYASRYVHVQYGVSVPIPFYDANNGPTNFMLRNDGEDRFTDVTAEVGLAVNNARFSLIGAWHDYDLDGDPDLYVANDFGRNNLYRNDGGRFVDVAAEAGVEDQAAGMGVSWGDYDLDGDPDLYVTNMFSAAGNRIAYQPRFKSDAGEPVRQQIQRHSLGNSLFANQGDGSFLDVGDAAGVRMGRWGWGSEFVDLNNDGYDDIVVPNGFLSGPIEDDL